MKIVARTEKLVAEQFPFELDFVNELPEGVTISSQVVTVTGPDAVLDNFQNAASGTVSTMWVRSGTGGATYVLGCKITSTGSPAYIVERGIEIVVR